MSAYLAYLVSETLALSGIVTLFFTGICHAHYSYYSVTKEAAITLKRLFEFAAFLSEMFVFAYLGLQVGHSSSFSQMMLAFGPWSGDDVAFSMLCVICAPCDLCGICVV